METNTENGMKPKKKLTKMQVLGIILYVVIILISLAALFQ